jgi:DNA invertase Pin-like site-specific DNA recombinase
MGSTSTAAAQYIRMSTDNQDLSPATQKDAIAAYAAAKGLDVVVTYEDYGCSGVRLKNRPALMQLLRDVTDGAQFSTVLVYDVSRWGRFQDTDAAAYYEYHCRLHGANVVYVAEVFGSEVNPITALLKSMKRTMAAEYSRELAGKVRAGQHQAVSLGFQMGQLPALGYRRCSVSSDGQRRVQLENKQRKLAATDRVSWVLGPQDEVDLVRRICDMYARKGIGVTDICRLSKCERWRNVKGMPLSRGSITKLLSNEVLVGNFVWGRRKWERSMVNLPPSRRDGCVPRIIDDETWNLIQGRMHAERAKRRTDEQLVANLRRALERNPALSTRDLSAQSLHIPRTYRKRLGGWNEAIDKAGGDALEVRRAVTQRGMLHRSHARAFGAALARALSEKGLYATFDGHFHVLDLDPLKIWVRLLWPAPDENGRSKWHVRFFKHSMDVDLELLVRMEEMFRPLDYFVAAPPDISSRFPHWLKEQVPVELTHYWHSTPDALVERLRQVRKAGEASQLSVPNSMSQVSVDRGVD